MTSAVVADAPELPRRQVVAYASGNFATTLISLVLVSWVLYFYAPPDGQRTALLSASLIGAIRGGVLLLGWVIEPIVGYLSDRTRTRFGRRLPWIALGSPALVLSFVLIWFPPRGLPLNHPLVVIHFAACLAVFWIAFTAVVAPYLALLPELVKDDRGRVRLATWLGVSEVFANIAGSVAAAQLIGIGALTIAGFAFADGFQLTGVVLGAIAAAMLVVLVAVVREPRDETRQEISFSLIEAAKQSLKNPSFLPYAAAMAGFRLAANASVIVVPYIGTVLMGTDEETAGYLLAVIIFMALFAFPIVQRLSEKKGKAWTFRLGGVLFVLVLPWMGTVGLSPIPPLVQGVVLFALSGFSVATLLVLPRAVLADVIDQDERRTGLRREAMYNGMSGTVEKAGEFFAMVGVTLLFDLFGNSAGHALGLRLVGLFSAAGVLLGLWGFRSYREPA